MEQPVFRIRAITYAEDGCYVMISFHNSSLSRQFKLDTYCYRPRWLHNFTQPDLNKIWQLAQYEHSINSWQRMLCYILVKYYSLKHTLCSWEEESKATITGVADDFEDW